jgi:pSer/pThr/pTyr-binding forkhead associated (FHA) protein
MPTYLADYEAEYRRLGVQPFVKAYPWPVLVVTGMTGALGENTSKSGTMATTSNSAMLQVSALEGRVFPVVKGRNSLPGPVSIGRTSDNDLAIPEYTISTHHCMIAVVDGECRLTDMGATNGTWVNDTQLAPRKPYTLKGGETIRTGRFGLLFHLPRGFAEYLRQRVETESSNPSAANKKVT